MSTFYFGVLILTFAILHSGFESKDFYRWFYEVKGRRSYRIKEKNFLSVEREQCFEEGTASIIEYALNTEKYNKVAQAVIRFDEIGIIDLQALVDSLQINFLLYTNEAIDELLAQKGTTYEEFVENEPEKALVLWRQHSIRNTAFQLDELKDGQVLEAVSGPLTVTVKGDMIMFTSEGGVTATVTEDCVYFDGKNYIIPIDKVLIPKDFEF
eukprot:TRINITY_DN32661_c0_g1_i1.p1 TRINITY_DN32661_c0_g1~~TRINITY_DN32661_c0_g1_i1.p1  ORF type:complete len:211 (-),score=32.32 TRINITY_DN32661_c0_g1_i1:207-839(-)